MKPALSLPVVILALAMLTLPAAAAVPGNPYQGTASSPVDIDVTFLEQTPRYAFDAAKNGPAAGDSVIFIAHLRSRGTAATGPFAYRWYLDGTQVATGTAPSIPAGGDATVTHTWTWQDGDHDLTFFADPSNAVSEQSEQNNLRTIRTNGLRVGFWVEQSVRRHFDEHQLAYTRAFGIADEANSWEDWAQRQMEIANREFADARFPATPGGVLDRWRLDQVIVVADGTLPLNGGLATNHPDTRDRTVDLIWGFEQDILSSDFYSTTWSGSAFNQEYGVIHELLHARYLVDSYGLNIHGHSIDVRDDSGSRLFPGGGDLAHAYTQSPSMMGGGAEGPGEWEAAALNLWANKRPRAGWANYNANAGFGWYLANHMPQQNFLRVKDSQGRPVPGATVQVYRADRVPTGSSDPNVIEASKDFYAKFIDNTVDQQGTTDGNGLFALGSNPFSVPEPIGGWDVPRCVDFIKIRYGGTAYPYWLDMPLVQTQYFRGNTGVAYYDVTIPVTVTPTPTMTPTPTLTPQPNPVPVLSGISPASATAGGSGFTLTVTGSGFVTGSKVRWNGADRTTTYVSSTSLAASIPASDIAAAGTRSVTVYTAAPGGGASGARTFTVSQAPTPTPTPTVTPTPTQTPAQITLGGKVIDEYNMAVPYTYVAVTREDTGARTYVSTSYDGSFRATVPYSTSLRYTLLTWDYSAREVMLRGVVPDRDRLNLDLRFGTGTPTATPTATPTPQPNPVPVISGISPASTTAGGSGFTLTVTGSGFVSGSKVRWNGADRTTTYISSTTLTASIPASDIAAAGTRALTVFTAAPGGGTSGAWTFTVSQVPTPTPTATPTATPTPATTVTLGGTVRDSAGRPDPYTYVYVVKEGQGYGSYVYTAADGSYRTSVPRSTSARYTIQAWDSLGGTMEIRGIVPDRDRLDLDLRPGASTPTPTPTPTPTATPTPTPTPTLTPTLVPDPSFQTVTSETATGTATLGNYDSRGSYYGPRMQTQSLKAAGSAISRVAMPLVRVGTPVRDITVTIENAWLQPVGWTTIPASAVTSPDPSRLEWVTAEFPTPVRVSKGSLYYVKLSVPYLDEKNYFLVPLNGGDPYQPGNWWRGDAENPDMTTDLLVKVGFSA